MERKLLEREISALLEAPDFSRDLSNESMMEAEFKVFPEGLFFGVLKEKSFLRQKDLRTIQKPDGKSLFFPDKTRVEILGEDGGWLLVEGNASFLDKGIEYVYSEKNVVVKVKGWIKKAWVEIKQAGQVRTIGFEFDIHYGFTDEILTNRGLAAPPDKTKLTTHANAADGFVVKLDGPRFEAATKPFTVDDAGLKELQQTVKNIKAFTKELQDGCRSGAPERITGFDGAAKVFHYPKMVAALSALPMSKLSVRKKFSTNCAVWAAPQATVAIPLSKIQLLIDAIKSSEGKASGLALSGGSGYRMGLRSEALYKAKAEVEKFRREFVAKTPKAKLSNGKDVDSTIFTDNFCGFLILLVSYLWTSELPYKYTGSGTLDYEPFAKAYLPINVKAPFPDIFDKLLSADEKLLFREHFAKSAVRTNLFKLAKRSAVRTDGSNKLFPTGPKELGKDSVHERQKLEYGSIPTWDDLVDHTLDPTHKGWGSKLMVPLSKMIGLGNTAPNVALELRRVGFQAMFDTDWPRFMENMFGLVRKF